MSEKIGVFPSNIANQHLLQAIAKIDNEGIPENAESRYYDVIFKGKKYPPKVIVSFANFFANGSFLDRNTFSGGLESPCFKLLEENGFKIVAKEVKLPFQLFLYNIHLLKDIENYEKLKSSQYGILIWEDSKLLKLNVGDYVFWLNREKGEALFTKISSKKLDFRYINGEIHIEYKGFTGKAKGDEKDNFTNFIGFEIIEKVTFDNFWNDSDLSIFANQPITSNLLGSNISIKDVPRKIDKLQDLEQIFNGYGSAQEIIQNALEILSEKLGERLNKSLTQEDFLSYISQFDPIELRIYFNRLKFFLDQLNITVGDQRLTYNYYNKYLILTIGQRHAFNYKPLDKEAKFFLMSNSGIGNLGKDNKFDGDPLCYFSRRDNLNLTDLEANEVLKAMKVELDRTEKSRYRKFNKANFEEYILNIFREEEEDGNAIVKSFLNAANKQNLQLSELLTKRYLASLSTKPFVIFTGLSGSGKTKLAQTFAKWICESNEQYKIIPVGADWTNREPLLGYPNSLDVTKYVLPDNGALELILAAIQNADGKALKDCKPYFLILDEMNLSHVERYFADFLSAMESKETIPLYSGNERFDENNRLIPQHIKLPPNLFLVGTVNIDETTYMFSPKVLDRANSIEFRVDKKDIVKFFDSPIEESGEKIEGLGMVFSEDFMTYVAQEVIQTDNFNIQLLDFFKALQVVGAEFGYRVANEMKRLIAKLNAIGIDNKEQALDIAIMQKLLPKLHGSRTKLNKVLPTLASLCFKSCSLEEVKLLLNEFKKDGQLNNYKPIFPLSFAKIARMYNNAQDNGFASFAEG